MDKVQQWKVESGTPMIEGRASAQGPHLPSRQVQKFVLDLSKLCKPYIAMIQTETVTSKLRFALQQIDSLPPNSGVDQEHVRFVRETLTNYLKQVNRPESFKFSDFNHISRLVIEYWPLSLPAGEAVIAAEQAMRKLARK